MANYLRMKYKPELSVKPNQTVRSQGSRINRYAEFEKAAKYIYKTTEEYVDPKTNNKYYITVIKEKVIFFFLSTRMDCHMETIWYGDYSVGYCKK